MANFRRSQRFPFRLPVLFDDPGGARPALTEDVSYHGLFIRTDVPKSPNQLVRFRVTDPASGPIELLGIVARCIRPEEDAEAPGIGVSLFGNARAAEDRWVELIHRVKAWVEQGLKAPPAAPPQLTPVDAVRRAHVRREGPFNITLRPDHVGDLVHFEVRDISEGGTFVLSDALLPLGTQVNLRLIHPIGGEVFTIPGEVIRTVDSLNRREKGMALRFTVARVDHAAWTAFLNRAAPLPPEPLLVKKPPLGREPPLAAFDEQDFTAGELPLPAPIPWRRSPGGPPSSAPPLPDLPSGPPKAPPPPKPPKRG